MDIGSRKRLLERAGLSVIDPAWDGARIAPMAAWKLVIGGDAVPAATVRFDDGGGYLCDVESTWRELSAQAGLFGEKGEFLIGVAGVGAATAPWALVKLNPRSDLAGQLAPVHGNPEFVAMDVESRTVCGVTSEEYEVWIVTGSFDQIATDCVS
ncbi:hypothetical protein [Actinocrinis sp.]|uniref:hypothetical protein n=1 Tax=Actinocrinis sp. TaxID=1920516 RepID=UPI002D43FE70|nr:hypothetical protein [Actinocrinis sp.]HZP52130.1 hypothetical protein [Actinocrinis sp.]